MIKSTFCDNLQFSCSLSNDVKTMMEHRIDLVVNYSLTF